VKAIYLPVALWIVYGSFVVWSVLKMPTFVSLPSKSRVRNYVGMVGLISGVISFLLFFWYYAHIVIYGSVVADGSMSFIYAWCGMACAALGIILGMLSIDRLRLASLTVSSIILLHWFGDAAPDARSRHALDIATNVVFASFSLIWLWTIRRNVKETA
jgi:hypothetical protein